MFTAKEQDDALRKLQVSIKTETDPSKRVSKDGVITKDSSLDQIIEDSFRLYNLPLYELVMDQAGYDVLSQRENSLVNKWGLVDPAFFLVRNGTELISKERYKFSWMKLSFLYFLAPLRGNRTGKTLSESWLPFAQSLKGFTRLNGVILAMFFNCLFLIIF